MIFGDLMIKNIYGGKLLREVYVILRFFSGSIVDDMIDFVRFFIWCKLDEFILYIGINDLKGEEL